MNERRPTWRGLLSRMTGASEAPSDQVVEPSSLRNQQATAVRLAALRDRFHRFSVVLRRLEDLEGKGVSALRIGPGDGLQVLEDALTALPPVASVIAGPKDVSDLDLRPRSRIASIGVVGASVAPAHDDRPVLLARNRHPDGCPGWRLSGRTWAPWPKELLSPRQRSAVPLLPGSYATQQRFYLPAPTHRADELLASGATMGRRGGFHVDIGSIDLAGPISAFLPFIAHPVFRPLPPLAIPSSAWGSSLAGMLTRSSWDGIRQSVFERWGGLCQICGQRRGGQGLECHEIWDFEHGSAVSGMHRQRLVGLACLCKSCHGAMHIGFSTARGHGDTAAYRLADMNGWSMAEAELAEECARIDSLERGKVAWFLDLSLLGRRLLTLDSSKVEERGGTLWHAGGKQGLAGTRIVGASFRIGAKGEVRQAA